MVESVRDYAIFQLDANGNIMSWNSGAERVLGWREQEAVGQSSAIVFTPEDRERASLNVNWTPRAATAARSTNGGIFGRTEAGSSPAACCPGLPKVRRTFLPSPR